MILAEILSHDIAHVITVLSINIGYNKIYFQQVATAKQFIKLSNPSQTPKASVLLHRANPPIILCRICASRRL